MGPVFSKWKNVLKYHKHWGLLYANFFLHRENYPEWPLVQDKDCVVHFTFKIDDMKKADL
jgi:hypothetical protein